MNWPPMLLRVRFPAGDGNWGLWLPLFLIYPLLIVLSLIALPLVLLAALILYPTGKSRLLLLAGVYFWDVLFKLRGLKVDISGSSRDLLIDFK